MKKFRKIFDICLDLFDGGAAAAGGDGGAASSTGAGTDEGRISSKGDTNAHSAETSNGNTRRSSGDENGNGTLDAGGSEKTLEERRKAYRSLVDGEYKDIYTEDTQGLINRRFKETKQIKEKLSRLQPFIDALSDKYGHDPDDLDGLMEKISSDRDFYAEAAADAGMEDAETYRRFREAERKAKAYEAEQQAQEQARQAQERENKVKETMGAWAKEAEALKAAYPDFDLSREIENKEFSDSLAFYQRAQVSNPVERAYKAVHHDELVSMAVSRASAATEKNVVDNIRAKGARPTENGTQSRSAFTGKMNVHNLSKAERAALARRAERGEKIGFSS